MNSTQENSGDWRCECGDLNRDHEAFCYRCGAGPPEDDEQAAIARMAAAGQALAVHWGHQPWSDSWAALVARTMHAAAAGTGDR